jgi:transposase
LAKANEEKAKQLADLEKLRKLEQKVAELEKENDFLKQAAAFFAKENK